MLEDKPLVIPVDITGLALGPVVKRDGRAVPFDRLRIKSAVGRAMEASGEVSNIERDSTYVAEVVTTKILSLGIGSPSIEQIQDIVEEVLILEEFPKTAKHYILYRNQRAEERSKKLEIPEHVRNLVNKSKQYFANTLSEFTFYRTYSRWIDEEERRETWVEAVARYMNYMKTKLGDKLTRAEYEQIEDYIVKMKAMPSMRLMWAAGKAADFDNACAYNCLTGNHQILTKELGLIRLDSGVQVATVLGHDGEWHGANIRRFGRQKVMEVVLSKGKRTRTIRATANHRWLLSDGQFKETYQLIPSNKKTKGDRLPIAFAPKPNDSVQEYFDGVVHGVVYGDGTTTKRNNIKTGHVVRLCGTSHELIDYFDYPSSYPESYSGDPVIYLYDEWAKNNDLKALPYNKSLSYTLGFIRGWLAADGSVNSQGQVIIATNEYGKNWLIQHSGVVGLPTTHVNEFPAKTNFGDRSEPLYRVYFQSQAISHDDLLLSHHKKIFKPHSTKDRYSGWCVKEVRNTGIFEDVYCANVPDTSTFVMEEGLVTGNCSYVAPSCLEDFGEILYLLMCGCGVGFSCEAHVVQKLPIITYQIEDDEDYYMVIEDSKAGWAKALVKGMQMWFGGTDIEYDYSQLRPSGAKLKTMGGRSSGPDPLKDLLQFTRAKILAKQGRRLSALDVHDIICKIGEIVVSGGVRRSSLISLSDLDDVEMRDAKQGHFFLNANHRRLANNSVAYKAKPSNTEFMAEWLSLAESGSGERGIFNRGSLAQQIPSRRLRTIEDGLSTVGTNPCGEIVLKSKQFCNLAEVVARSDDTLKSLKEKIKIAAILGTYQSMLTDFPFLSPEWKENCEQERLLGVSITGQWDSPEARKVDVQRWAKAVAIDTNKEYAERFGINPSAAVTCIKPSGTVSPLVNSSSGIHTRYAQYYIRRVRISATDPLFQMMKDQKYPYVPEVGQSLDNATTFVLDFPVKAPDGAITRNDLTAIEQLNYWKQLKEHFTEHNPSCTIYVGDDEWIEVGNWVYNNWDMIGGLAFLPRDTGVYRLAPHEEITKEEYEQMMASLPTIDYSMIMAYEREDTTEGAKALACLGDKCEI